MAQLHATILLVDDDEDVLTVTEMQLESLGCTVVAMLSAQEALAAFQTDPRAFDLVITDGLMPDMTGTRLAQRLSSVRPDIPVILCTGFSPDFTPEMAKGIGCRAFVMKPMSAADWSVAIQHVLNGKGFYSKI